MRQIWWGILAVLMAGCGGGGAGVANSTPPILEIRVQAPLAATVYYAMELTVRLPPGVSVASDPETGEVNANVLEPAVAGTRAAARYVAAGTGGGALRVNAVNPTGLTVGTVMTVACRLASGTTPTAADFTADDFSARNENGVPLEGVTPEFAFRMPQ